MKNCYDNLATFQTSSVEVLEIDVCLQTTFLGSWCRLRIDCFCTSASDKEDSWTYFKNGQDHICRNVTWLDLVLLLSRSWLGFNPSKSRSRLGLSTLWSWSRLGLCVRCLDYSVGAQLLSGTAGDHSTKQEKEISHILKPLWSCTVMFTITSSHISLLAC